MRITNVFLSAAVLSATAGCAVFSVIPGISASVPVHSGTWSRREMGNLYIQVFPDLRVLPGNGANFVYQFDSKIEGFKVILNGSARFTLGPQIASSGFTLYTDAAPIGEIILIDGSNGRLLSTLGAEEQSASF